jgi:hypothetical protein
MRSRVEYWHFCISLVNKMSCFLSTRIVYLPSLTLLFVVHAHGDTTMLKMKDLPSLPKLTLAIIAKAISRDIDAGDLDKQPLLEAVFKAIAS